MVEHRFTSLSEMLLHHSGYCREITLDPVFIRVAACLDFLCMDDNSRPRGNAEVSFTLESKHIKRMEWPDYSSDLNHIEHV